MLKMLSSSFPIFALSNHTTFSKTQTNVTVPLRFVRNFFWTEKLTSILEIMIV
jgi:hypothetical protein